MRADAVQQLRDVHGPDRVLELLPGLFRLPIPLPRNPLRELNAYLIRGRERSLLIDTGFREPACRQALQAGLRAAGAEHDPLDVLLTHIHTDHTGLASEVVRPGGAIYIGRGDYPFTSRAWEEEYWGRIDQRFLQEGFPPEELRITTGTNPARTLGPDLDLPNYQPLEDGDRLTVGEYTLEVIAAPGHTPGQICLWMANQQVLFTADHVLFDITPNITMWPNLPNALGRYLESLTRIGTYPARLALPGHRHTADLAPRIQALLAHHRRRAAETLAIVRREGGLNAYQVASRMTWDIRADSWADFPLNQKWFATGEALAYLTQTVGYEAVAAREAALVAYAWERMGQLDFVELIGHPEPSQHHGVISFNVRGVHPHDVASILDMSGVCIRAGHHCAQPLLTWLGVENLACCRASLAFYNDQSDVDRLVDALTQVWTVFHGRD